ncbi:MAG: hypothetical protein M3Q71_04285 [Chloroflexota bacterium]|nr:hypothetical protein [Chloroflexota bacterium]
MALIEVGGVLATTQRIPKYGGLQLTIDDLHHFAKQLLNGGIPMLLDHDERQRLQPQLRDVQVRQSDTGEYSELRVVMLVEENEWERWGERRGFSISFYKNIKIYQPLSRPPFIGLGVEAFYFADDVVDTAARQLLPNFNVETARLYQLIEWIDVAKVTVDIVYDVLVNIQGSLLYDVLRPFLSPSVPQEDDQATPVPPMTEFVFKERLLDKRGRTVRKRTAILRTNSEEALKNALDTFGGRSDKDLDICVYNEQNGNWEGLDK